MTGVFVRKMAFPASRKLQRRFIGSSPNSLSRRVMQDLDVNRRLAAWLLTLPGPWEAASHLEAIAHARGSFDPRMHAADFQNALTDMGYVLAAHADTLFHIEPRDIPLSRAPALRRAA